MILFSFFGSLALAAGVAFLLERFDWTHHGLTRAIFIAWGAVLALFFVRSLFHLSLGSPGVDAIVGALAALILIPADATVKPGRRRNWRDRR